MTCHPPRVLRCAPLLAAAIAGSTLLVGCARTTYDASVTTVAAADTTTSTTPTGPAEQLLPELVTQAGQLSNLIAADADPGPTLARVEAIWLAVRDEVSSTHPELVDAFDRSVDLCRTAVERNRPADADKATKNLTTLVEDALR